MEKTFTIKDIPLAQLLRQADEGELQLPDFQRGWIWDDSHIVSLLASISHSFPIGAVMTLATGNPKVKFRPRPLEGVKLETPKEPALLLLDGQQRLTSLYFALRSRDAVPTCDHRGNEVKRHYYADIDRCIDPFADREDNGIVGVPEDRLIRVNFGRTIVRDLQTRKSEIQSGMFPLDLVFNPDETEEWQMEYVQTAPTDSDSTKKWRRFRKTVITPFRHYQVPTIELEKATAKEAVCQVFEKVNTGGVSLTVFELLTATFAADNFNLREDWKKRHSAFEQHPALGRFSAPDFLQVVTLIATYDRRITHLEASAQPPVSCKRRDILKLTLEDYRKWADSASNGLKRAVEFLHGECIFEARDVPYASQLVPLGAIFAVLGERAENHAALEKLRRWYWCGVFGEMYGGSTETRFAFDLPECIDWVTNDRDEPRTVKDAQFHAERLRTLRTRNSAAYKGLYALQMKASAQDFKTGVPIDVHAYFDNSIDIHHVFPKAWCAANGFKAKDANSVVNKTPIGSHTNRMIGSRAPSKYLQRLENKYTIDTQHLDMIVGSHDMDPTALRQDDFEAFFNDRFERMIRRIADAMGKPVNRNPNRDESPFADPEADEEKLKNRVRELISDGENDKVEFKSSGRKNLHTGRKDPAIEWAIVKSIAAFMNTLGGTLLVGIDDAGQPVGIEEDYPFVMSNNRDGWEQWLTTLIAATLGKAAATSLRVRYCQLETRSVAHIQVSRATKPVFAQPTKAARPSGHSVQGGKMFFYVRMANGTQELVGNDLLTYTTDHWPT